MVFKTLHWYIFRELFRIFLLTTSALTTLMAFVGLFRPLTKLGVEVSQLMTLMMYLMPAMLAYAIPIAALFAAVMVYWRLSTDNELTACRASGISFVTIVMPALILGITVASIDLVFVNYVVPMFLQRAERAGMVDIGSIITTRVNRQEVIRIKDYAIYANSATQKETADSDRVVIQLEGVAATRLKDGKPTLIVAARQAEASIRSTSIPEAATELSISNLVDAMAFDPRSFERYSGTVESLMGGRSVILPSTVKSKPKFLNLTKLREYTRNPSEFDPVKKEINQIATIYRYQAVSALIYELWRAQSAMGTKPLIFKIPGNAIGTLDELHIYAPFAAMDAEKTLVFAGDASKPVEIRQYSGKKLLFTYTSHEAVLALATDELSNTGMTVSLQLRKHVTSVDHVRKLTGSPGTTKVLAGIVLPAHLQTIPLPPAKELLHYAKNGTSMSMRMAAFEADVQIRKLIHTIKSELHSRGSFSVSCLLLVLLGAALGILLRGKNPLAVFVVGFVPAIFLVLLITAGRQMAEGINVQNVTIGLSLIWAGNVVLLALVIGVYAKLLRQ